MSENESVTGGRKGQLPLQTADLIAAFMIWVMLSTLLPFIKQDIYLSQEMSSWVIAVPMILGSVLRIPFGYLTARFGARKVYLASFAVLLLPIAFLSEAREAYQLLIGSIFLGVAGAIFSVGVTSLPKYYPKQRHGFVNGIYGLGNIGTAVTAFGAPWIAEHSGWSVAIKAFFILSLVMVVANFAFGDRVEKRTKAPILTQLKLICRNSKMWAFSFFYFVTFGAFVAFSALMPDFATTNFGFSGTMAGIVTGIFIVLAAGLRVLGGWLADRYDPYVLLALVFGGMVLCAVFLSTSPAAIPFLLCLDILGICCGIGNGVVFKLVPMEFIQDRGVASGFVAMMGGLGGFFPPLVLSFFLSLTGSYSLGFFFFLVVIAVCLMLSLIMQKR